MPRERGQVKGGGDREDYVDERFLQAPSRAAEILVEHWGEWSDEIDAYWLLRRYEDEIGVPVTYDIVVEAVEIAHRNVEALKLRPSYVKVSEYQ
ncbi:hypothetical protein [Hyperthermus butylicus]|uniref:Uncharacterized protein n=1 Tax=Hyperthermus butylicus (strain DSM 5456 / JCM 9403 / PLM1-5) TaxID=415426 RepID=A2BM74_HYPBU|nr:hypothetical protein [Hyperthermus butylicus]ABM81085.1 hypothetical protein Hbut_1253 [Hyperthermus butylicus DSM 5456]